MIDCFCCSVTKSCLILSQPLELQLAKFLCPWDFPDKNAGVGCHFLLQWIFPTQESKPCPALAGEFFTAKPPREALGLIESENDSCSVMFNSLRLQRLQPTRFLSPWNSPGKNTGVGCHSLLQGIFLTQGWRLGFLHWKADSLPALYIWLLMGSPGCSDSKESACSSGDMGSIPG